MGKKKHKPKVKKKHLLELLEVFRGFVKERAVLTDDEDRPAEPKHNGNGTLPKAVVRALQIADEFTSGVNGDVSRLRDAVRTALACTGVESVSKEHPLVGDLYTEVTKAHDHDTGYEMGLQGYEGDPPPGVRFPDSFAEGQKKGLEQGARNAGEESEEGLPL